MPNTKRPVELGRVDPAGQHFEADALGLKSSHQLDDMSERAADPVELPDHKGITGAELVKCLGQAWPVDDGAAANVLIQPLAPDVLEGIALKRQVLLGCGHAHVADQHVQAPLVQRLNKAGFTR
jgi:hypothetical protein